MVKEAAANLAKRRWRWVFIDCYGFEPYIPLEFAAYRL